MTLHRIYLTAVLVTFAHCVTKYSLIYYIGIKFRVLQVDLHQVIVFVFISALNFVLLLTWVKNTIYGTSTLI